MTVVNITDRKPTSDNEPVESVVDQLEKLLELAKEGRLRVFALTGIGPGEVHEIIIGEGDIIMLLGMMRRLEHYINTVIDIDEMEE